MEFEGGCEGGVCVFVRWWAQEGGWWVGELAGGWLVGGQAGEQGNQRIEDDQVFFAHKGFPPSLPPL